MIHRKQKSETLSNSGDQQADREKSLLSVISDNENSWQVQFLAAYQAWKTERLLKTLDGKSLFLRSGVEKQGLTYQLACESLTQSLAILLSVNMMEQDPDASKQAEALFAYLLAHPAYGEAELSSWRSLPDLPNSPKLDPDPQAEAWLLYALNLFIKRNPEQNRFDYLKILPKRAESLQAFIAGQNQDFIENLPCSTFLEGKLKSIYPHLDWLALGESNATFRRKLKDISNFETEHDTRNLFLGLLQLGLLAYSEADPKAIKSLQRLEPQIEYLVKSGQITSDEFSQTAQLACLVPALLIYDDEGSLQKIWKSLINSREDKDDGLGATLKFLALSLIVEVFKNKRDGHAVPD
jgi:hypothetical protein